MERTEFQQRMAELKEQSERRRYDVLRKKYAIAPNFSNISLRDEVGVRYDLDELEQLKQKYGVPTNMPVDNDVTARINEQAMSAASVPITAQSQIWETANAGKQVYDNVVKNEGNFYPQDQNAFSYDWAVIKTIPTMLNDYLNLKDAKLSDKYKHAYINCRAAQNGKGGSDIASITSNLRELNDIMTGANTLDSSKGDNYANKIGRLLGTKYPKGDCDEIISRYIKKYY